MRFPTFVLTVCQTVCWLLWRWSAAVAAQPTASTTSSCRLTATGTLGTADTLQYVSLHCTSAQDLNVVVDPVVEPFLTATGELAVGPDQAVQIILQIRSLPVKLHAGVNVKIGVPAAGAPSALFSFSGETFSLVNCSLENLTTTKDSVVLLQGLNISIVNSSFIRNQGVLSGGMVAEGVAHVLVDSCHFSDSSGSIAQHKRLPYTCMVGQG